MVSENVSRKRLTPVFYGTCTSHKPINKKNTGGSGDVDDTHLLKKLQRCRSRCVRRRTQKDIELLCSEVDNIFFVEVIHVAISIPSGSVFGGVDELSGWK